MHLKPTLTQRAKRVYGDVSNGRAYIITMMRITIMMMVMMMVTMMMMMMILMMMIMIMMMT